MSRADYPLLAVTFCDDLTRHGDIGVVVPTTRMGSHPKYLAVLCLIRGPEVDEHHTSSRLCVPCETQVDVSLPTHGSLNAPLAGCTCVCVWLSPFRDTSTHRRGVL